MRFLLLLLLEIDSVFKAFFLLFLKGRFAVVASSFASANQAARDSCRKALQGTENKNCNNFFVSCLFFFPSLQIEEELTQPSQRSNPEPDEAVASNSVSLDASPSAEAMSAWKKASSWPASGLAWLLRSAAAEWEPQLHQLCLVTFAKKKTCVVFSLFSKAGRLLRGASVWSSGVLLQRGSGEVTALFWRREGSDWMVYVIGRAENAQVIEKGYEFALLIFLLLEKAFGGMGLLSMLVEDVLLRVWGNKLFEGIASIARSVFAVCCRLC